MAPNTSKHKASNIQGNETAVNVEEAITKIVQAIVNTCEYCHCSTFDKFYRLQPPTFVGGTDPLVAEEWIGEMEKIFEFVQCTEEEKVRFATFMLRKHANVWWKFTRRSLKNKDGENNPIGWERFKAMFLDNYFPQVLQHAKEDEFLRLEQGTLTLAEYASKFEQLSQFAPYAVDTNERMARRFEQGLRPELRRAVAVQKLGTYGEVLQKARLAAHVYDRDTECESTEHSNGKRSFQCENYSQNSYGNKKKARVYACYFCGEEGHRIRECPYKSQS